MCPTSGRTRRHLQLLLISRRTGPDTSRRRECRNYLLICTHMKISILQISTTPCTSTTLQLIFFISQVFYIRTLRSNTIDHNKCMHARCHRTRCRGTGSWRSGRFHSGSAVGLVAVPSPTRQTYFQFLILTWFLGPILKKVLGFPYTEKGSWVSHAVLY